MSTKIIHITKDYFDDSTYLKLKKDFSDSNGVSLIFLVGHNIDANSMYLFNQEFTDNQDIFCMGFSMLLFYLEEAIKTVKQVRCLRAGDVVMFKNNEFYDIVGNFNDFCEKNELKVENVVGNY